jgi:endonuclease/exonuclease/phosphatase (EEP) superfamily protein YafD
MKFLIGALRWAVLAALAVSLTVLTGVAFGSLHWTFDLAAQFLLPSIALAGAAAIAAALARWPRLAAVSAIAAAGAFATAWPWTLAPAPVAAEAPRFKVLLFNIRFNNGRLDQVREMVARENPDLVVFVEVTDYNRHKLQPLSTIYPYRFDCIGTDRCDILIFSRGRLTSPAVKSTADPDRSPVVRLETDLAGCPMMLYATHLTRPFPNRPFWAQRAQAEELAADVAAWPGAKLVLGDFNAAPWGYVMRTIAEVGNVEVATGFGGTWHSRLPAAISIPIDHMAAGPGLSFVSRTLLPQMGSDHLPVMAEIAVTDPTQCR